MKWLAWALTAAACFAAGWLLAPKGDGGGVAVERRVDTIVVRQPSAESWTRLGVLYLPRAGEPRADARGTVTNAAVANAAGEDTLAVGRAWVEGDTIVMEQVQRHYADSLYEAWVSGPISPRLDSIRVLQKSVVIERKSKPKRWHIGVTAGWGYVPGRGMQPYAGVGVTYSLKSF